MKPSAYIVILNGRPHPEPFEGFLARRRARAFVNAQRAQGHSAYIISKGFK